MTELLSEISGRYKALSTLGEGGMGVVVLAEDSTNGARVALKVLDPKGKTEPAALAESALLFKREFRAMSRFRHPNNCEVFDYGLLSGERPYFTMEHVEGEGLDALLPLPESDVRAILRQLCRALNFIHRQGFVHGDLKPENVRLRPDGVVKLMDFGLVDVVGNSHGSIRGTIAYMAPEVAKGGRIDQRSDIYALGALLYHLLAGRPPFVSEHPVEVLRAHTQSPVPPLEGARGPLSAEMVDMVAKMLEKEPIARFQSINEVLVALGDAEESAPEASLLASEFIGRGSQLETLQTALEALLKRGEGSQFCVFGPPGVGKTRVLGEFRFSVQLENVPFLQGHGASSQAPYGVFIEILKVLVPRVRELAPAVLAEVGPGLARLLPGLDGGLEAPALETDQEKVLIQASITRVVAAALGSQGGVLVIDDWDRADALSLETLTYLQRNLRDVPLLLVLGTTAAMPEPYRNIEVGPFDASEVAMVVNSMLGISKVSSSLLVQLVDWSGGVASNLGSLLEHCVRTGAFSVSGGAWQLPESLTAAQLPANVAELMLGRLDSLAPPVRALLDFVAVYNSPVSVGDALAVMGLSDDVLLDALDELCQARLLHFDGEVYRYAVGELRAVVYQALSAEHRAQWHHRVALHYETSSEGREESEIGHLTVMAQHFLEAACVDDSVFGGGDLEGLRVKALAHAVRAAERHQEFLWAGVASDLLEAAWHLLNVLPGDPERLRVRARLLNMLAMRDIALRTLPEAQERLSQAVVLAEQMGDRVLQGEVTTNLAQIAQMMGGTDDLERSVELNQAVVALALETGAKRQLARAYSNLGRSLFFLGRNEEARDVFERGVSYADAEGIPLYASRSRSLLGYLLTLAPETRELGLRHLRTAVESQRAIGDKYGEGYTYMVLANVLLHSGMFKDAEAATLRNAEIMRELGSKEDLPVALFNHALVLHERGDFVTLADVVDECYRMAVQIDQRTTIPLSGVFMCLADVYRGNLETVYERLRRYEKLARETSGYILSTVIPYVIEVLLQLGHLREALRSAQEARDLVASTGNTEVETRLWIGMGEIHARLGEYPAARSYFERAQEHGLKGHEPHIVVRAEKGLGWLDLLDNRLDSADERLTRASDAARRLDMRYLRLECEWLLGELALARGQRPDALGYFQEAVDSSAELGARVFEAVSMGGMARSNADPARAARWQQQANTKLDEVIAALPEEEQQHFLSFTERAQVRRHAVPVVDEVQMTDEPISEVAPAMADDAPIEERSQWLTRELGQAAGAAAQEARRMASVAREYGVMADTVQRQAGELEDLRASNRRMEQLMRFSMAVSNLHDLDKILEEAVDMIVELTEAERGFLLFFENGQIRSQVSRVNVDRRSPLDWQFSKSIAEKVLSTGEAVCVFDALADKNFNQKQSVVDLNLRTVICVPMRIKGRVIGAIYVDRQSVTENFTPSDLEMVLSLAAQAASAIENARLHQEWIDKSKRLEMLNNLSKTISGSLDMEEVLDLIVKMTLEVSRAERGFLFLVDDGRKLNCRAARDAKQSLPLHQDHEVSMSICNKVLQTGEPENVADALNDEEFQFQHSIMALNLRMVMCVPITAKGAVIGLLYVDSQAVVNAFGETDLELLSAIAGHASVAIENAKLHAQTIRLADDLKKTFYSFVTALGASIDAKHPLTAGHSWRVTEYAVRLARRIGMSEEEVENIRIAGLLHDVGKIGTPDAILMKPGSFTNEEYEIMKRHVVHTREILDTIHFPEHQRHIPAMAGAHHEKWDGKGYPDNLAGEDIPLGGRILALGDVFDAITSKRDYREAMPLSQAVNIIRQGIGTHFDPALGPEFVQMIEEEGVVMYHKDVVVEAAEAPETAPSP
ncbi:MAG: HD domain-containing phosphohydrolase [Candidatus Sericytochromatia bacterium]|nr:HD domain-containing phosphohydrolase [Candidatus Sericytochromatia bacterium]